MPKQKDVKITNGDLTGTCLESAVPAWERNGWTVVDDGSSESSSPEGDEAVAEQPEDRAVAAPVQNKE